MGGPTSPRTAVAATDPRDPRHYHRDSRVRYDLSRATLEEAHAGVLRMLADAFRARAASAPPAVPYFAARVLLNENEQRDPTATEERLRVERWIAQAVRLAPWIRLQINAVHPGLFVNAVVYYWRFVDAVHLDPDSMEFTDVEYDSDDDQNAVYESHVRALADAVRVDSLRSLHLREAFVVRNGVDVREGVVRLDDAADEDHRSS